MDCPEIVIGYAPTRRDQQINAETAGFRESIREKIAPWGAKLVDIDGIDDGMLYTHEGAKKAAARFLEAGVQGIFIPHCNFGCEKAVAELAKLVNKPVLLWGPRDGAPQKGMERERDTQCGLFVSGKALRRVSVPFTYLTNCALDDPEFERGYRDFAAVCGVVHDFKTTRILQISVRPEPFWSVICNEGELLEKFNISVMPITFYDLKARLDELKAEKGPRIEAAIEDYRARLVCKNITEEMLLNMACLQTAIESFCEEYDCNAAVLQCWDCLKDLASCASCTINGILTERGLPVICEDDIHGALTARILQAAAQRTSSIFFADLTVRHPTNNNAELLWHCGNFAPSLARDPENCSLSTVTLGNGKCVPSESQWEIRHGDITLCRFDGDHGEYQLLMGEGRGVDGPETIGTYCWFEADNWAKWEHKLVTGPYIHHVAGVHGKFAPVLFEACKYLGIKADPAEPGAEALEAYWQGWGGR